MVAEYWKGIHWVLDYYSGKPVDTNWVYAWHYPPLWADLLGGPVAGPGSLAVTEPLTDVEQLALVLPVESWDLLPPRCKERKLPLLAPEWFPVTFGLNKIGRKFEWEYEPDIPIPTVSELRARLSYYAA